MNIRTLTGKVIHELREGWEERWYKTYCGLIVIWPDETTKDAVTCKRCITAKARAERIAKALAEPEKKDDGEANP